MKNIFTSSLTLLLLAFCLPATAQQVDINKKPKDSLLKPGYDYYVPDSLHNERAERAFKAPRAYKRYDSVRYSAKAYDSMHKKVYDTARTKRYTAKSENLFKEKNLLFTKHDSLQKMQRMRLVRSDSLRQLNSLKSRQDTLNGRLFNRQKSDSLRKQVYLEQIKTDSQRIKKYLQDRKIQLQKLYADTATVKNGFRSRNLSMEITCRPGDTVFINNEYKKVVINVRPSQKVRLSTSILYKDSINEFGHEVFRNMGIEISRTGNAVTASIKGIKQPGLKSINKPGYDDKFMERNGRRTLEIDVPGNAIVVLNCKYAEAKVENFITNFRARINNGNLHMENAGNIHIVSNYSTIKVDNIRNANLNLSSTTFTASNIVSMTVVSGTSKVKIDNCQSMNMASTGDDYQVEKAGSITGNKEFGKLEIETLSDQLLLTGSGADVRIKELSPEAPFIRIDNKYADLKLPVYNQANYALYYEGSYNDVNKISAATQKLNSLGSITARLSVAKDTLAGIDSGAKVKTRFEAVAGNTSGRHTRIDIVCPYCNVVFN